MDYRHPLISIITVCLNSERTIAETIESVIAQSYDNYEYLILDGESTDGTLLIINRYKQYFGERLIVLSQKDDGIYNAINKGILQSRGELIGIINSDDYYSPHVLEKVAEIYSREKCQMLVVNGDMMRISNSGENICRYHFTQEYVARKECFGHPAMFAARAVYDHIGLYNESYRFAADGEWQFRAHDDRAVRYLLYPEIFSFMREGGASDNPRYAWQWFRERSRMRIVHCRGSIVRIYVVEIAGVVRTFLKAVLPCSVSKAIYRYKYRK